MDQKHNHKKVTKVALTSITPNNTAIGSRKISYEKAIAIIAMIEYDNPVTSRKLSQLIVRDRSNCTRILYELKHSGVAIISKIDVCEITGRRVQYYELNTSFVLPG